MFRIVKRVIGKSVNLMKQVTCFLLSKTDVNSIMQAHYDAHLKANAIDINSVKNIYSFLTIYLRILFVLGATIVFMLGYFAFGFENKWLAIALSVMSIVSIMFLILTPFKFIYHSSVQSSSKLFFIVLGYLIVILLFTLIYMILDSMVTLKVVEHGLDFGNLDKSWFTYIYFSIVTITTLGYGDILPVSMYAQVAVVLELFLGVQYAVLGVGTFFSSKSNDEIIAKYMKEILDEKRS